MTHRHFRLILAAAVLARAGAQPRPDLQGFWSSATATPLERPVALKDKAFFTKEEAAEWERRAAGRREEPKPEAGRNTFVSYNALFYETGLKLYRNLRTSIITEPPDGRIPALTAGAAAEMERRREGLRHPARAADMGLQDQCVVFPTAVAPMRPYIYNSNYQIVQTEREIAIHAEMIHDTRIIRLDRKEHLAASVQQWLGDSLGRWDGDTLVVDTTNFHEGGGFFGEAGGFFGTDRNLHVVERFRLLDADALLYRFEVDDPTAYTRPWAGEMVLTRSHERMFEYACTEGNYALPDLLNAERELERGKGR